MKISHGNTHEFGEDCKFCSETAESFKMPETKKEMIAWAEKEIVEWQQFIKDVKKGDYVLETKAPNQNSQTQT